MQSSASYMPKRQGPQDPAVKKTCLSRICWRVKPSFSRNWRYCTRLPTVKYVGLYWPLFPNSFPIWKAETSGTDNFSHR
jgi:hypothetical protein